MKQEEPASSALRVPGKFEPLQREVCVPLDEDLAVEQGVERIAVAVHDKRVGCGDALHGRPLANPQNERVIEAARPLQHRSAPAAPAQYRNAQLPARIEIHFSRNFIRIPEHHEVLAGLPEAEDFIGAAFLAPIEQRLVTREILLRSVEGSV